MLIAGARLIPPDPWKISDLMSAWSEWVASAGALLHPVSLAAQAHHRLAAIHPFIDGNGRTARLVINLLLMKQGYPPTRHPPRQPPGILLRPGSGRCR